MKYVYEKTQRSFRGMCELIKVCFVLLSLRKKLLLLVLMERMIAWKVNRFFRKETVNPLNLQGMKQ